MTEARRKKAAEHRAKNRESLRQKAAEYRAKNREKIRQSAAEYRKKNKDKRKKSGAKYRAKNKSKILQSGAEYRQKTRERKLRYQAEYRAKNKEKINEKHKLYKLRLRLKGKAEGSVKRGWYTSNAEVKYEVAQMHATGRMSERLVAIVYEIADGIYGKMRTAEKMRFECDDFRQECVIALLDKYRQVRPTGNCFAYITEMVRIVGWNMSSAQNSEAKKRIKYWMTTYRHETTLASA